MAVWLSPKRDFLVFHVKIFTTPEVRVIFYIVTCYIITRALYLGAKKH